MSILLPYTKDTSSYTIFAFAKRVQPLIYAISPDLEIIIKNETMVLFDGKESYSPSPEMRAKILLVTLEKDECLLYDATVTSSWEASMLPIIPMNAEYSPRFSDGKVYITIAGDDYLNIWNTMYLYINNSLSYLRNQGALFLPPSEVNTGFINDWNMLPVIVYTTDGATIKHTSVSESKENIYIPAWKDVRITRNQNQYLIDRLNSYPEVMYTFYKYLCGKERLMYAFKGKEFHFVGDEVSFLTSSYIQAVDIANTIERAEIL